MVRSTSTAAPRAAFFAIAALVLSLHAYSLAGTPPRSAPTLRQLYGLTPPAELSVARTALLVIDFQDEFFRGKLPLPDGASAAFEARKLVAWARRHGIQVVHVHNIIDRPNSPLFAANTPSVRPLDILTPAAGDHVVIKATGGAFTGTDLHAWLRARHIDTLILAGLMTHLAVQLTATDASLLGYHSIIASDATATRPLPDPLTGALLDAPTIQHAALASLADRHADILPSERIRTLPRTP